MRHLLQSITGAVLFLWLLTPCLPAQGVDSSELGQTPIIHSWGTEAGLPQNTVTAIVQDRDGYMWLGTRDGLARFDGVQFKVFGLEKGLPSVDISCLFEDHQGILWIGTYGAGLCRMRQGQIEIMADPGRHPGSDTITCLAEDATGQLWVGTSGGLRFCRAGKMVDAPAFTNLLHSPIHSLLRSRDGKTMWIASVSYGLMRESEGRLKSCPGPAGHEKVVGRCLFEDHLGRLWVGIGNGAVLCRDNDQWRIFDETNGLPFAYVTSITEDAGGTIWAGSLDAGLYRFDGARFNPIQRADGLSAEDIRSLYCDHEDNLWVGTRTGGLNRLSKRHLLVVGSAQGLTNDFTRSVAQTTNGTLWVGTVGGSLYYGGLSGFQPFRPEPVGAQIYYYANVDPVLTAPDGSLWWGGNGALLAWKDNQLTCYTNESWIQNVSVTALQNDRHGGIWIGTSGGQLVHLQQGHFHEFPKQLTRAAITSLAVQPDGSLWVGAAAGGVKRVREGTNTVLAIASELASTAISTLHLDGDGTLWIGTAGGGLSCWQNGKITNFTPKEGLAARTVSQIVEDDHGFLWLGCNSGIYKVSKRDLTNCASGNLPFVHSRSFGITDGMLASECSGGFCPAGLKTKSGLICISTVRGLVFIDPSEPGHTNTPPKVLLEELRVNEEPQTLASDGRDANSESTTRRLIMAPGKRDLAIDYTAVEFSAPEKIGFRYKLEGQDNGTNWSEPTAQRTFKQHIPPGDYVFHVQACNADGVWSTEDTTLAITARPFAWETTWFHVTTILTLSGLMAGMLWWILRRRYRFRLNRLQTLNAIERERLRISKDMHDHVGGMLTQMSQLSDLGLNEAENQALVKHRFERIGDRSRVAVQALDEIVWATNPLNDNLASFAEYVSRFCDEFFEYTNIRCWQEVPTTFPSLPLRADVRHNVFLAVREAFNNALKHSKCTEVWLRMKLDHGQVTLEIEDNGCGFVPGQAAAGGNGLGNMQARLVEDNGRTVVISAPGKGTRIRFVFPVTS